MQLQWQSDSLCCVTISNLDDESIEMLIITSIVKPKPGEDSSQGVRSVGRGGPAPPEINNLLLPNVHAKLSILLPSRAAETTSQLNYGVCHSLEVLLEDFFDTLVARSNIALHYNFRPSLSHLSPGI